LFEEDASMGDLMTEILTRPRRMVYGGIGLHYFYTAEQSVQATADLFASADDVLIVLSGELYATIWRSKAVKKAIKQILAKDPRPRVEVLFGPLRDADPIALKYLRSLDRADLVSLSVLPRRYEGHFAVADGADVKVEDPHAPNSPTRTGYVAYRARSLAATLERRFRALQLQADPVAP
jgi:hypothetical protein